MAASGDNLFESFLKDLLRLVSVQDVTLAAAGSAEASADACGGAACPRTLVFFDLRPHLGRARGIIQDCMQGMLLSAKIASGKATVLVVEAEPRTERAVPIAFVCDDPCLAGRPPRVAARPARAAGPGVAGAAE